jgi:hypothetical protein
LLVQANHYSLAGSWISQFLLPLKSFYSIHLAIASCEDLSIVTLDHQLFQNAQKLDIDAILLSSAG